MPGATPVGDRENPYRHLVAYTRREHRLFSATLELTYRCNLGCSHCYLDVAPPHATADQEMTAAEYRRTLDDMAELGALNLTLSGGEILARKDFFAIAEYARAKRFSLRLYTNGTLVDPAAADRIAVLHPYAVEMSVYSTVARRHEAITGRPGSFQLSRRAFGLLRERGVRTVMKTPLMRENVHELEALQALARELGAQFRYDITITPKDDGGRAPLRHRLAYEDLLWVFRRMLDPGNWTDTDAPLAAPTCSIGRNALVIDPHGNVFPCIQVRLPVGNVRRRPLRELWEKSPIWADLAELAPDRLIYCRGCELRALCVRCHGLALLEAGDLGGPAHANCRAALARRQVLIEKGAIPPDYPVPAHLREVSGLS